MVHVTISATVVQPQWAQQGQHALALPQRRHPITCITIQAVWSDVSAVVEGVEVFGVDDEVGGLSISDEAIARETRTWPVRQLPSNSVAGALQQPPVGVVDSHGYE
jgi:hypothetical protein